MNLQVELPKTLKQTKETLAVIDELLQASATAHEIALSQDLHKNTVSRILHRLHDHQLVFISKWIHPGDSNTLGAVWAWRTSEEQKDANRPRRKSRTQINKDYNRKHAAIKNAKQRLARGTQVNIWAGLM